MCKRCIHCDRPMDDEGDYVDCVCSDCVWEREDRDRYEDDLWI